jgi:uncharacterized protein (DUF885 family)
VTTDATHGSDGGAGDGGVSAVGADATNEARLDALAAAFWEATLEANPTFATSIGDRRYDDRMPDPTPEGAEADRARYARLLEEVEALGPDAALAPPARVTRSALREVLGAEIAALGTGLRDWNVDSLEGVPAGLILVQDYQPVTTPADGRLMVARWHAMARYVDAHAATLRRALAEGRVASRPPVDRDIALLDGLLAEPVERWPLVATPLAGIRGRAATGLDTAAGRPVPGRPTDGEPGDRGWTTAERERFAADLLASVRDDVRPAFARLRATLADEIRPAARSADEPGMGHVPGGPDGYRRLVRVHTSLDLAPDELHRTGLAEIDRIDRELTDLAGRVLGTRSLAEALAALRDDPALGFATRDEVYDGAVAALARARRAIPDWFGRLPRASCEVVRMGAHEEEHGTIAYYRGPAADGSRPGQYYINTAAPRTRRRYEAEVLAYHEAIPGHHLQIAIGQELEGLPEFRRHLGPTAFFEGWGLYTERLADEMGLYSGDLDRIGVLSFDAWRAARLVVDTGMHALGWSRDRAIAYMTEHTALATNNIANEIDRYIVLPGQALAYKTGQLEMLRLRTDARNRLGASFDVRGFHDALLGQGAVPLPTLREMVDRWAGELATGA